MRKLIFMLFGRSRSGKSTIMKALMDYQRTFLEDLGIHCMIPLTTRPKRDGESSQDYFFVNLKSYGDDYINNVAKDSEEKFGTSFAGVKDLEDWVNRARKMVPDTIPTDLLEHRSYNVINQDGEEDVWEYGFLKPTDPINLMIGTPEVYHSIMEVSKELPEDEKYIVVPIYIDRSKNISVENRNKAGENSAESARRSSADDKDFSEEVIRNILHNDPSGRFLNCEEMDRCAVGLVQTKGFENFLNAIKEYMKYYIYSIFGNESFGEPSIDPEYGYFENKMYRCERCDHVYAYGNQLCPKCLGNLTPISSCGLSFVDAYVKQKESNPIMEHVKLKDIRGGGITCNNMDALKEAYVSAGAYKTTDCKTTMQHVDTIMDMNNVEYTIEYPTIELECDEEIGAVMIERGNKNEECFDNIDVIVSYDREKDVNIVYIVMRDIVKTYENYHVSSIGYQFGVCRQKFFKNALRIFMKKLKFSLNTER